MKTCYICGEQKPFEKFGKNSRTSDGLQIKCIECKREYERLNYLENVLQRQAQRKIIRTKSSVRNKNFVLDYLSKHPCVDCGNTNVIVLDFDHINNDKEHNVSDMTHRGWSLNNLKKEIEKCEVRCANCHRIVTYERRKNKK